MGQLQWAAVLLSWLLGVVLQYHQNHLQHGHTQSGVAVACALFAGLAARFLFRHQHDGFIRLLRTGLACLAAAMLGWGHAQWQATSRWEMRWPSSLDAQTVELTGRVDSMPNPQNWGQQFEVSVTSVTIHGQYWQAYQSWGFAPGKCPDRVLLTWGQAPPALLPGQTWRWKVQMHAPDGLMNPGGFDAQKNAFVKGIRAQGKVMKGRPNRKDQADPALLLTSPTLGGAGQIDRWRHQVAQRIFDRVPSKDLAGLLVGLTVGQQSAITPELWRTLRNTGIAHLASISGLHITMLGWLFGIFVGALWRLSPRLMWLTSAVTASRVATLLGAVSYAMFAGWGIPAQRTVWMLALVMAIKHSGRRWPFLLVLLVAAVGVTILDPWALVQASFWLSFAAVALLMLATDHSPIPSGMGWCQRLRHSARELWRTQWIATLGLAPLTLAFFQTLSVLGFFTNLVCIPLFTLLITPLSLMGLVWPLAWDISTSLLDTTMAALTPLANHPAALWQGQAVQAWAAGLAMLGIGWCLMPLPWRWRLMAAPTLLFLLWPNTMSQSWPVPPPGQVQVLAADVGQGTAVVVRTNSHALLYDTGARFSDASDMGLRVLVVLLRAMGVRRLDELMISHADADHVGGAASVIANVPVVVLRSSLPPDHPLLKEQGVEGIPRALTCLAGQRWTWDGVDFEVLYPHHEISLAEREAQGDNATSCVLHINAHGRRVLLTGDIETNQEAQLLAANADALRSEVLIVPHHGSRTSSTPAFLAAVAPEVAVIQAGQRNRYGHPHQNVVARYKAMGIPIVQTATCGAWAWQSAGAPLGQCWRTNSNHYWQN